MSTITENLQIIKNSTLAMKQSIIDKGGTINGDITTWANSIANIPSGESGGSSSGKSDVIFYDYDGNILYSFSKDEFLALNELPSLPTQPGLTCQGWNYDITKAKDYVEKYGKLNIGATYITDDGKTRLYIRIDGRKTTPLYFSQTVDNGVTIDWGDGSTSQTLSGTGNVNTSHTYTNIGDYCITLTVVSGCTLELGHNINSYCVMGSTDYNARVYCNMLQKVEMGTGVTSIGINAFHQCTSLSSVVIPESVTSIGDYAFRTCYSLSSVVIPDSVTLIESYMFNGCSRLSSVVIPDSVTSIKDYAFQSCVSLRSIVIPDSVTSTGIRLFTQCYSLSSVVMHDSITSIGSQAFYQCFSLSSVVIPSKVTSIGSQAFYQCYGMPFYDFSNHTSVPTLVNKNAFESISSDCKIIVPDNLYDTWISATNWSTYASNIIKKSDWYISK